MGLIIFFIIGLFCAAYVLIKRHNKTKSKVQEGYTLVNIDEFKAKFKYSSVVPWDVFCIISDAEFDGKKEIAIPTNRIKEIELAFKADKELSESISRCAERNNRGMQQEKTGDIDGAIALYEENISDTYPATHSYDRLMVLYRRRKDYYNELRVIESAIEKFTSFNFERYAKDISRWKERKIKTQELRDKSTSK